MKVLVCGGRDYTDEKMVFDTLDNLHRQTKIKEIIQGGARGADKLARLWAFKVHVTYTTYYAAWIELGPSAGPIRNQQMIDEGRPDLVVAFPGGRGTADMVSKAREAKIPIMEVVR